jgi:cardiolipin synthase
MSRQVADKAGCGGIGMSAALVALLLVSLSALLAVAQAQSGSGSCVLITELYPNTATEGEQDEYFALTNPCDYPVNLEGWRVTDTEGSLLFPAFALRPNQAIYVARNASVFVEQLSKVRGEVVNPDFEYGWDSDPTVLQLQTAGKSLVLRNAGDELLLYDATGGEVDVVLFGDATYNGTGWSGAPLAQPREGMILCRRGTHDINQRDDWLLLPFGASYHEAARFQCAGTLTAFVSPDCSCAVLEGEIANASSSLLINLYEFDNLFLMECVEAALARGVEVQLLLEGTPVGGVTAEERFIAARLAAAGGSVRFYQGPYINHAKYAVIDNRTLILTTENWGWTGVPVNTSFGNRGWGVVIRDQAVANYFTTIFSEDFYPSKAITVEERSTWLQLMMNRTEPEGAYVPAFEPRTVRGSFAVLPFLAPDTALSSETIVGAIQGAQGRVFVEQFSVGSSWGEVPNPFLEALIDAARRGCEVKLLLDSNDYNLETLNDNDEVIRRLERLAREEQLNLEARLADLDALGLTKIHAKGLVVDGTLVMISSLNWNANSVYNREAGVIVERSELGAYYDDVFQHDWQASEVGMRADDESGAMATGEHGEQSTLTVKLLAIGLPLVLTLFIFMLLKWYKRR